MNNWRQYEKDVFAEIQKIYPEATLQGGSNSYTSDVLLPDGSYIDIKMPLAQCGQTVDASQFDYMKDHPNEWAAAYYKQKNVKYWAVMINNNLILTAPADIHWYVEREPLRGKRSGSRALNKKWLPEAEKILPVPIEESNGTYFVQGDFKNRQLFESPLGETFILSECGNNYFAVRIRGKTQTQTAVMKCCYRGLMNES